MADAKEIIDTPVGDEVRKSFLAYAMSVVVARALPDVRDGLKPVHRRILYGMADLSLAPNKAHVKSAKVVGHVMGSYHPHGDSAIYETLVRLAQDYSMRLPLVDGHGNFGTLTDPAAASRYTEARMAPAATAMTDELDEDTVDFQPNYEGSLTEPKVLPAAFPNLLVNGGEGIAVGMATKLAPHNLGEVVAACQHLLRHPDADVDDMIALIPGPDLPTGAFIHGLDGVHEAYRTGRGAFRIRARAEFGDVSARRKAIIVTELPYQVGPEHVIAKIKEQRETKRLHGVANVVDLSDMKHGLRLVIECKTGFNPGAVLAELYKTTPLEIGFSVHNLALVDGAPQTLTLLELVTHYVNHRREVTRRRCEFRKRRAEAQAHLLEGYLVALAHIEEVVATIRGCTDTADARAKLMAAYLLSELQTNAILEMPLRRLTSLEVAKIEADVAALHVQIAELAHLLTDAPAMVSLICDELENVARIYGTPRRTTLLDASPTAGDVPALEVADEPCRVTLSSSGLVARFTPGASTGARGRHDALVAQLATTTRSTLGAVTSLGRLLLVPVIELPAADGASRGGPVSEFVDVGPGEQVVALVAVGDDAPMLALGTRSGLVKRVAAKDFPRRSGQELFGLKDGDQVVGAHALSQPEEAELVFVTSDAQLLRMAAAAVRAQGRAGGGMAGVKLAAGAHVLTFCALQPNEATLVVTVSDGAGVKLTPLSQYPAKGRATAGVRCMRLLKGETCLVAATVSDRPLTGVGPGGALVKLPVELGRRDGSGPALVTQLVGVYVSR